MNPAIEQIVNIYKGIPLSRRIAIIFLAVLVMGGFIVLFIWNNQTRYKPAYTELNQEDASEVVAKLKEANIPYEISGGGSIIMVPENQVYDVRLSLAKDGIPKGSGVGYEIFDQTDFGTTEFVQKINRKRAIQGELARTIRAFDEVKDARVMIVLPEDSVFVEETKKPSASILLELKSELEEDKVAAIAHLVASSIQDLSPRLVTIVDTAGRILFEGKSEEEKAKIEAKNLADAQYQYKIRFESTIADRIQTMLERIVGKDKAIVRVTAEMDFSTDNVNEEIYDPFERETKFIRSQKLLSESVNTNEGDPGEPSSVNPITAEQGATAMPGAALVNKRNDTVNFELSRRTRQTVKPMAVMQRLSVAAVVDGNYEIKTDSSGNKTRSFVPRSAQEMQQFKDIVVKAMGYNEIRQDQVSVECFPFASIHDLGEPEKEMTGWRMIQREYGRTLFNVLLGIILLFFVIRPLVKTAKGIKSDIQQAVLPQPETPGMIEVGEEDKLPDFSAMSQEQQKLYLDSLSPQQKDEFLLNMSPRERKAYLENVNVSEKAAYYAKKDINKTSNIIKGWMSEMEEDR